MASLEKSVIKKKAEYVMEKIRKSNNSLMVYVKGGEFVTTKSDSKLSTELATNIPECVVGVYSRRSSPSSIMHDMIEVLGIK